MELWVGITIAAAFLQNVRSGLQRHLTGSLSTFGAAATRFLFAVPFAALYFLALHHGVGMAWPEPNLEFLAWCALGGVAQIAGTALLVATFRYRNFAVGTAYSKTETMQTALFAVIVLGEAISVMASVAIAISFAGVVILTLARAPFTVGSLLRGFTQPAALLGMGCGAGFGISAVAYRAATLSLDYDGFVMPAATTLACVTILQSVLCLIYMRVVEPGQIAAIFRVWRPAALVGVSGAAASAGWFTAMAIEHAAYVRAVGQVELVFTFIVSAVVFRERSNLMEVLGVIAIGVGILVLVLAR